MYTTQPVIKSGCVLRRANVGVLEREKLVTQHEVRKGQPRHTHALVTHHYRLSTGQQALQPNEHGADDHTRHSAACPALQQFRQHTAPARYLRDSELTKAAPLCCAALRAVQVDICKSRMNTFAYMGDLKNSPEVACVYHSEEAENQYLDNLRRKGGMGAMMQGLTSGEAAAATAAVSGGASGTAASQ